MIADPNPSRRALDRAASAPDRVNGNPLARAARLIAGLRPDWQRCERFHEAKAEALACLRAAAAPSAPPPRRAGPATSRPAAGLRPRRSSASTGFLGPPRGSFLGRTICGWRRRNNALASGPFSMLPAVRLATARLPAAPRVEI